MDQKHFEHLHKVVHGYTYSFISNIFITKSYSLSGYSSKAIVKKQIL